MCASVAVNFQHSEPHNRMFTVEHPEFSFQSLICIPDGFQAVEFRFPRTSSKVSLLTISMGLSVLPYYLGLDQQEPLKSKRVLGRAHQKQPLRQIDLSGMA